MKVISIFVVTMMIAVCAIAAVPSAPLKMRPYTGIGIILLPITGTDAGSQLPLYEEPALSRLGELNIAKIPAYDWIFGLSADVVPLIVTARKGSWLRVAYDDAGREAWLNPPRQLTFQPWDLFFKSHISRLLPGLQKKYYQMYQQPDTLPLTVLTVNQLFKVLRLENDWAMVLIGQDSLGWLRWRDEDGRLLIGIENEFKVRQL